jgi:hypothetical protein
LGSTLAAAFITGLAADLAGAVVAAFAATAFTATLTAGLAGAFATDFMPFFELAFDAA